MDRLKMRELPCIKCFNDTAFITYEENRIYKVACKCGHEYSFEHSSMKCAIDYHYKMWELYSEIDKNKALSNKLKAYEDTGLSPAEIIEHEEMFKSYRHICGGKSPEEIQAMLTKLENGTLVELPCGLGDKAYTICRNKPKEWEVCHIGLCGDGGILIHLLNYKNKDDFRTTCCNTDDIGKTVFLTQADAEQKLSEINSHE